MAQAQKEANKNKRTLVLSIILPVVFVILTISAFFIYWAVGESYKEKIIEKAFHADIKQFPNLKVIKFLLWEGDSLVTLDIPEKGQVSFWYGIDRVPEIRSIGKYFTSFTCFKVDNSGTKVSYAYDTNLRLASMSPYIKWFSFQVNSIADLISRHDDIVKVLDTFPKKQKLVDFHDSWGNRQVLAKPNLDFLMRPNKKNGSPVCDLYL